MVNRNTLKGLPFDNMIAEFASETVSGICLQQRLYPFLYVLIIRLLLIIPAELYSIEVYCTIDLPQSAHRFLRTGAFLSVPLLLL